MDIYIYIWYMMGMMFYKCETHLYNDFMDFTLEQINSSTLKIVLF